MSPAKDPDKPQSRYNPDMERNRKAADRVYRELVKTDFADADRFQVLCHNCNCGKYRNGGICPHQEAK